MERNYRSSKWTWKTCSLFRRFDSIQMIIFPKLFYWFNMVLSKSLGWAKINKIILKSTWKESHKELNNVQRVVENWNNSRNLNSNLPQIGMLKMVWCWSPAWHTTMLKSWASFLQQSLLGPQDRSMSREMLYNKCFTAVAIPHEITARATLPHVPV